MTSVQLLGIAGTTLVGMLAVVLIVFVAGRRLGLSRRATLGLEARPPRGRRRRVESPEAMARHRRQRRRRLLLVLAGLVSLAAVLEAVTLAISASDLTRGVTELTDANVVLGTNPANWTSDRISSAGSLNAEAQTLINHANRRIGGDPFLGLLRQLPLIGDQVTAVVHLSDTATQGSAAFDDAVAIAGAVNQSRTSNDPPGPRLLRLISQASGPWTDADARLSPALDRLRQDLTHPLVSPVNHEAQRAINLLQPIADLARVGAVAAKYGPAAMGVDRPQNYLVLLSNPSELRPAGGFNGSIGWVTLDKGAPASVEVKPQEYFNPLIRAHTDVPYPMGRYLTFLNNSLEIGDAGWDPDFPSTARLTESLYTAATARVPDNTISIDPYAFAAMLQVTGPVDVAPYGTFDAGNFFSKLNFVVNASKAPGSGKGALSPIGEAVLRRVLTAPASLWPRLFLVFQQQAERRHIQVYFHDPHLAAAAAQVHYDGQVRTDGQDYLMVSDGSVSQGKEDYYAHKSMQVSAEVDPGGLVRHEVRVRYQMPIPVDDVDRALNQGDGSYRDYVRFYLPEAAIVAGFRATLDGGTGDGAIDSITFAHGRQVVGAYFRVPRGHEAVLTLTYVVPIGSTSDYQLTLQKQAGIPELTTTVLVSYPGGISRQQVDLSTDSRVRVAW